MIASKSDHNKSCRKPESERSQSKINIMGIRMEMTGMYFWRETLNRVKCVGLDCQVQITCRLQPLSGCNLNALFCVKYLVLSSSSQISVSENKNLITTIENQHPPLNVKLPTEKGQKLGRM